MDDESDRVVMVSHCILNQSTRARWGGGGARRDTGILRNVLEMLMDEGVGVVQIDCPEFSLFGNPRRPRTKEGYDTPEFREVCGQIAGRVCDRIVAFQKTGPMGVEVVAVLGVEGSPSCGVGRTPRIIDDEGVDAPEPGLLMETLMDEMRRMEIETPIMGMSLREGEGEERLRALKALITAKAS
jgi:predicted secreted protein